ncbi:MAG: phosphoribosyltransferase family protein [Bacteroidota bacterium]
MSHKIRILDQKEIYARLKRMAFEVYERNYLEEGLLVLGIGIRGGFIAKELCRYLAEISTLKIERVKAQLDKSEEGIGIEIDLEIESIENRPVIVVDDVLYTGTTMLHVVSILLQAGPSSIQTAVLIDRGHRSMPVSPDFVGLELATTIQQHVSVDIAEDTVEAFLL